MELAQFLDTLELNSYEKDAILFLAGVDGASAVGVSKGTSIPQGRVYSVLHGLCGKGIAEMTPGAPKRFSISNVKEALSRFIRLQEVSLSEKLEDLKQINAPSRRFNIGPKDPSVKVFTGRDSHLQSIISLNNAANESLCQIAPLFHGSFATRLSRSNALNRGVTCRVITQRVTEQNRKTVMQCIESGGEVRVLDSPDLLSLLIRDGQEFLVGAQDYHSGEERFTIYSQNRALLLSLVQTFEDLWKKSKPVRKD